MMGFYDMGRYDEKIGIRKRRLPKKQNLKAGKNEKRLKNSIIL